MKKWLILSAIGIIILIVMGIYFLNTSGKLNEMNTSEELTEEEIINLTKMKISELSSILMKLQLKSMVKELPGKNFVRI